MGLIFFSPCIVKDFSLFPETVGFVVGYLFWGVGVDADVGSGGYFKEFFSSDKA